MKNEIIYTQILIETLKKKKTALEHIKEITGRQTGLLTEEKLDLTAFDTLVDEKNVYINTIQELDEGFQITFDRVREELKGNQAAFRQEISQMQELIKAVMSLSMEVEAAEQRNKAAFEQSMSRTRNSIRERRVSSQSVTKYYQSAMGSPAPQSFYLDKKK